jgi:hypothetical protein
VRTAQVLENPGVKAYDGAPAHIECAKLLTAGATIATVEACHASYLNLLNRDVPFPAPSTGPSRRGRSARLCRTPTLPHHLSRTVPTRASPPCATVCPTSRRPNVKGRSDDTGAGATASALSFLAPPAAWRIDPPEWGGRRQGRKGLMQPDNAWDENVGFYSGGHNRRGVCLRLRGVLALVGAGNQDAGVESLVEPVGSARAGIVDNPWRPCEPCNRHTLRYNRTCCK